MILICGGAGYIGAHANKRIHQAGYETVVFDNLVYGHREAVKWGTFVRGDLADSSAIGKVFQTYPIDAVMHFAAYAYVGESVAEPEKYYYNNVANTLNLLHAMREHGCNKIVFSSTCATYGEPDRLPITEDMPQNPVNPYGMTKLTVERILRDYSRAYGLNYAALRYFNAAGADLRAASMTGAKAKMYRRRSREENHIVWCGSVWPQCIVSVQGKGGLFLRLPCEILAASCRDSCYRV